MAEEIPLHPFYAKINSTSKQVKTNLNKLFSSKFFLLTGIFNLKKCLIRSVLFLAELFQILKDSRHRGQNAFVSQRDRQGQKLNYLRSSIDKDLFQNPNIDKRNHFYFNFHIAKSTYVHLFLCVYLASCEACHSTADCTLACSDGTLACYHGSCRCIKALGHVCTVYK